VIRLPDGVLGMAVRGAEWAGWVEALPGLAEELLADWQLTLDGAAMHGYCSLVLPVRTPGKAPAVLKIGWPDAESEQEHLALQVWGGRGAVRLLRADPRRRAMLLERLHQQTLADLWDVEACEVVASLYGLLHVPAGPQLRTLAGYVDRRAADLAALPRSAPLPHRYVDQAAALARDFAVDEATTGVLIHTDLHYANVLASAREPWLAIDPKPMNGDPHYEVAPMLWNRFEELTGPGAVGSLRDGLRRRLHTLVDASGLDEARARDWVVVRMMLNALGRLEDEPGTVRLTPTGAWLTMCVAVAKAVQD
jgi:streptomycin 6-kinase